MIDDTLKEKEPHPGAQIALEYIQSISFADIMKHEEAFASCSLSGNRTAEICLGTLRRILNGDKVSDRYIMGLAWVLQSMEKLIVVEKT